MRSPLGFNFFGLTQEYRKQIFRQIHEIIFHGGGGYDYETIYNMPIWLRQFTFNTIREHFEKINEQNKKQLSNNTPTIARPDIKPNYTAKARK